MFNLNLFLTSGDIDDDYVVGDIMIIIINYKFIIIIASISMILLFCFVFFLIFLEINATYMQ